MVYELEDTSRVENLFAGWEETLIYSVHLAEKFGYEFDQEYIAYEVASSERTH